MVPSNIIDLTGDDSEQTRRISSFVPSLSAVSHALNTANLAQPNLHHASFVSKKRKRGVLGASPSTTFRSSSESIEIDDSETETSTPPKRRPAGSSDSSPLPTTMTSSTIPLPRQFRSPTTGPNLSDRESASSISRQDFPRAESLSGTDSQPIEITEDEDDLVTTVRNAYPISRSGRLFHQIPELQILGSRALDNDDDDDDMELLSEASDSEMHTLFSEDDYAEDYELPAILERLSIEDKTQGKKGISSQTELLEHKGPNYSCAAGKSVELHDGTFMRILSVVQNATGATFIRGHQLVREDSQTPTMPKRHNELIWILPQMTKTIDSSADVPLSKFSVSEVKKNRDIVFTNQRYPMVSSKDDGNAFANQNQDFNYGPLFTRWKRAVSHNAKGKVVEESFYHLLYRDADSKVRRSKSCEDIFPRILDSESRSQWRRIPTSLCGGHDTFALVNDLEGRMEIEDIQKYSFGDAFCGAGGTSRGALDAGLFVKWGFDLDQKAMGTYSANFAPGGTDCRHEAVDEFLTHARGDSDVVDVVHASPPCQTFSWAKTFLTPEQDEKNEACLFSIGQLLQTTRPRIVTMEETDGLVSRHQLWFQALIHIFIHVGYSVRWKIVNCEQYGVPQTRKRLIILAAG